MAVLHDTQKNMPKLRRDGISSLLKSKTVKYASITDHPQNKIKIEGSEPNSGDLFFRT